MVLSGDGAAEGLAVTCVLSSGLERVTVSSVKVRVGPILVPYSYRRVSINSHLTLESPLSDDAYFASR